MRKVFLENLPHGGPSIAAHRVNWKASIGCKVPFIYDDIKGEFEIVDYDVENKKYHLHLLYKGKVHTVFVGDFSQCRISRIVGRRNKTYLYQVGDIVDVKTGKIKITEQILIKRKNDSIRGYRYECLTCHQENKTDEGKLKDKQGCPVCTGQKTVVGVNDMWTTNPSLAQLLADPTIGYQYMQYSNKRFDWKCPECGSITKSKTASTINYFGLSCKACSDSFSYPEKLMYNLLKQVNVDFEPQKKFEWSGNKRYDFYVEELNTIIEVHGNQHYDGIGFEALGGITLREQKEVDEWKEKKAKENGITHYIVIDARKSELDFIQTSIQNSPLILLLNLSNVDWLLCHQQACSTLVKTASDLWMQGHRNTVEIGKLMHLEHGAVRRLLKKGALLGWCDYSVKKIRSEHLSKIHKSRRRKVICLTTNERFDSVKDASKKYHVSDSKITSACRGNQKTSGKHPVTGEGLKWMYLEEYEQIKEPH